MSVAPRLQGARLLVVEDDFLLLMDVEAILRDAGAQSVAACRTVEETLEFSEFATLDAAILDVRIGRESVAPVAHLLAAQGTPFIFYTGQVSTDPVLQSWSDCPVVQKPALPGVIVDAIAKLLKTN